MTLPGRSPSCWRRLTAEGAAATRLSRFAGFAATLEDNVALPFETEVLGVTVTVHRIELTEAGEIVALCRRGEHRQAIPVLDLPLPMPPPEGAEWILAYHYWARGGR